jgi:NADPH:quinone reductase
LKALRFKKFGDPSVLTFQEIPTPKLAPGEVLIEVRAAGINPSDLGIVAGKFKSDLPRTPGRDFAGVVVRGNDSWAGKQVWGSGSGFGVIRDGSHAQFVTMPTEGLSEKPAKLSMEEAASIGVPYVTAWESLVRVGNLREGERVLITGSNGAVGAAAIQIAHWRNAFVIGAGKADSCPEADAYINTKRQDLVEEVQKITRKKGVDLVLDTVGATLFEPCLRSLAIGGRQIAIASPANPRVEFNLIDFYHKQTKLFGVDTVKMTGREIATALDQICAGFDSGHLRAPQIEVSPFGKVIEVYRGLAAKTLRGKQVLSLT